MLTRVRVAAVAVAVAALACMAERKTWERDFVFTWEGRDYDAAWQFGTTCPPETLLHVFFQPHHIRRCMERANLTIEVLDSGETRNRIAYTYAYLVSTLRLTFLRELDTAGRRVTFVMQACSVSGTNVVPTVVSSEGYYAIVDSAGAWRVRYWQKTVLDRDLNDLYMYFIRGDTRRVVRNQERYSRERRWQARR